MVSLREFIVALVRRWWALFPGLVAGSADLVGLLNESDRGWDPPLRLVYILWVGGLIVASYLAYREVWTQLRELSHKVDFGIEFSGYPRLTEFEGTRAVQIDDVLVHDHTDQSSGVLRFRLVLHVEHAVTGVEHHELDEDPFQSVFRRGQARLAVDYMSNPLTLPKTIRRHLCFVVKPGTPLISDAALRAFKLEILEVDSGKQFEVGRPGSYRFKGGDERQSRSVVN